MIERAVIFDPRRNRINPLATRTRKVDRTCPRNMKHADPSAPHLQAPIGFFEKEEIRFGQQTNFLDHVSLHEQRRAQYRLHFDGVRGWAPL